MLKIRLRRMGSRHRPFYRVVVSDSRRRPTSSALEEVGTYDPRQQPSKIDLKLDRVDHWISRGAKPSETVGQIIGKARRAPAVVEAPAAEEAPVAEATEADADEQVEAAAAAETADDAPEATESEAAEADDAAAEA